MNQSVLWLGSLRSELMTLVMQTMVCKYEANDLSSPSQFIDVFGKVHKYDVAVFDLTGLDNFAQTTVITNLSNILNLPMILVLLPKAIEYQAAAWLNAGADRCLPAEISISVIRAMIRSMLHRCSGQPATYTEHGLLRFEHDTNTLFYENAKVELTYKETLLTSLLLRNVHRYIGRDQLFDVLCSDSKKYSDPALVYLYIHRLNKKLCHYGIHIGHSRGNGYRILYEFSHNRATKTFDCSFGTLWKSQHSFDLALFSKTWLRT